MSICSDSRVPYEAGTDEEKRKAFQKSPQFQQKGPVLTAK